MNCVKKNEETASQVNNEQILN